MAIVTRCEHCGHPYEAPDNMAGRKVRCRNCGLVFALIAPGSVVPDISALSPQESPTETTPATPQPAAGEPFDPSGDTATAMPAITKTQSNMEGGVGSAKSFMERPATDPGIVDFADSVPQITTLRPSEPFTFPFASDLDRWLPVSTIWLMLLWIAYFAWSWEPTLEGQPIAHPTWAHSAICVALLLAFVCIWLPLMRGALRRTSVAVQMILPEKFGLRAAALASLPFTLGGLFWLTGENLTSLIIGMILGLLPAIAGAWFLIRLKEKEISYCAIAMTVSSGLATLFSVLALVGLNALLAMGLSTFNKTSLCSVSPLGPGLSWPTPAAQPAPPVTPTAPKIVKTPTPVTPSIPAPAPVAPPVVAVRTPENTIPTVAVPPINATVPTPIAPPTPPLATPPVTVPPTVATPPENPITPATPATPSPVALLNGNPLVKQVQALPIDPATTQVIYPLNNTDFFATIIPSGNAGDVVVEAWSRSTGKRAGRTIFAGNPPQPSFAISPSGDLVARIATFPSSSIQIWSYAQNRVTQTLAVDANLGTPRLLGFPSNTSLIWEQRGNTYGAEYFDLTTGKSTTLVDAADKHAGVIAFSPDGKQMAAIVRFVNATNPNVNSTMLFPYNSTGRNNLLTMQRWFLSRNDNGILANPSGIAYSPDGKTIARAYEQTGQLLLVTNRFPDGKQVSSTVIPGGINLDAAQQMNGPEGRMLWLGDAHNAPDILYGGRTFIEISTGKIIGELPLTNVLQQRQISPGHLHLLTSDAVNKTQLLDITLN